MSGAAGGGDDDLDAAPGRFARELRCLLRRAVGLCHIDFIRHGKAVEGFCAIIHNFKI